MNSSTEASKIEANSCHWCGEKLQGLLAEFVHCVKCNERRIIEGLDHTYDACPTCMTVKSRRLDFLNADTKRNGDDIHD